MSHGQHSRAGIAPARLPRRTQQWAPAHFSGFGYLLGPPDASQRSTLADDAAEADRLLRALSKALPAADQYWPSPLQHGADPDDNPSIPSGYTYLLQLVAHDLVQTTVPFWAASQAGLDSRNLRAQGLLLDTLYGGGPAASPLAYGMAGYTAADRTSLRLGRYQSLAGGAAAQPGQCPFRDLARINLPRPTGPNPGEPANFEDAYATCIADARNDDNLILAQLLVLFASVHNAVAGRLTGMPPEAVFGHAEMAMKHIYYNVVCNDLLQTILHPHVFGEINSRGPTDSRWLWDGRDIPLEFSHGAFRIGHAMVRPQYQLNATPAGYVDIATSLLGGQNVAETRHPLRQTWLVQWSRFFELSQATTPNYSRRLAPTQSALDAAGLFRSNDALAPDNLSQRDFLIPSL